MKVARGRSWQPEIGMEHASRGRRSGNKGVGARWRGRFRIFSARHCSRTKVSHAENSGMTMLFFSWRLLRCRRGILSHPQERRHEGGWFLFFLGGCSGVGGCVDHGSGHAAPCRLRRDGTRGVGFCFFLEVAPVSEGVLTTGVVMRRRAVSGETARGGLVFVFSLAVAPVSGGVLTTGVVIRRRATTEWMARGGWFLFFS